MSAPTIDSNSTPIPLMRLLRAIRESNGVLWLSTLGLVAGLLACLGMMLVDERLFNGINVWDKPAKFFLSLAVQFATVGFALSHVRPTVRNARSMLIVVWAMVAACWFEMIYIVFRAARAEASHFNATSALAENLYSAMAFGALTLTGTAFYIGLRAWRERKSSIMAEAAGLGLMLGMAATTIVGMYMGQSQGHWVGGELTDAHGTGFFSWSTTGGDLRVAHFASMHAAQALPLAALSGSRALVYLAALAVIAITAFTFVQAVLGIPLFRL